MAVNVFPIPTTLLNDVMKEYEAIQKLRQKYLCSGRGTLKVFGHENLIKYQLKRLLNDTKDARPNR